MGYKVQWLWITKRNKMDYKECVMDYKVCQGGLQSVTGITKCGGTAYSNRKLSWRDLIIHKQKIVSSKKS